MKRKNLKPMIISALLAVGFGATSVGTSFALFTDKADTKIDVTAGKVDLEVEYLNKKAYSLNEENNNEQILVSNGKFATNGTYEFNDATGEVTLTNMVPGDKIEFDIKLTNNSNVKTKYRFVVSKNGELAKYLKVSYKNASLLWEDLDVPTTDADKVVETAHVVIELPNTSNEITAREKGNDNKAQGLRATYKLGYEIVQGNAQVEDAEIDRLSVTVGTSKATYYTIEEFRDAVNDGSLSNEANVKLLGPIDLAGVDWSAIGTSAHPFNATFDGNGKTIKNLTITSGSYIGLFGYVGSGTIKNLKLENFDISGLKRIGGLAGEVTGNAKITNVSIDETSKIHGSDSNIGGLVGEIINGTDVQLDRLVNKATVQSDEENQSRAGGIVGQVTTKAVVTIKNSQNYGKLITNNGYAGGIVSAYQGGNLTIDNCSNETSLSNFIGTHKANLLGWVTSVKELTIKNYEKEVNGDLIGAISKDYTRHFVINNTEYFLKKSNTQKTFAEMFAAKEQLNTAKMDRIIDFFKFAKTKNSNFASYPETYWALFDRVTGFGGDGWPQLLAQYNQEKYGNDTTKYLTEQEFTPDWTTADMYYADLA